MNWNPRRWFQPKPYVHNIGVGSRVVTPKNNTGTVRCIVGHEAWVKTGKGQNVVVPVSKLKRPDV